MCARKNNPANPDACSSCKGRCRDKPVALRIARETRDPHRERRVSERQPTAWISASGVRTSLPECAE
jgi:hypothetical protein